MVLHYRSNSSLIISRHYLHKAVTTEKRPVMNTLNELCAIAERSGSASFPLRQACARPRSAADLRPLPAPNSEAAFDSSREAVMPEAAAASRSGK